LALVATEARARAWSEFTWARVAKAVAAQYEDVLRPRAVFVPVPREGLALPS
jgi:hypothetical protein